VSVADFTHPLEVSRRRREAATGVLDGFKEDGCDSVGTFELNSFLDPVGGPDAERLFVIGVVGGAVEVGVRNLVATASTARSTSWHQGFR